MTSLRVPGAVLHYETRGTGPFLLISQSGDTARSWPGSAPSTSRPACPPRSRRSPGSSASPRRPSPA
ncbi:hypothetical protein [Nonomuraea sp. NPDC050643]|uniref:hypothetical protein n=1 Tax=Nonomuraea sp. NPDC050643 TaxID=3155660 RepID=UPI0033EA02DB